ncbi:MAG: pyrroline-5-carboxylate reductase [Alphaproteobacteria bacterium]|nr:pyrroline-5-carboxylate reductase [Alphaproteobacteria bacterium]
MTASQKTTKLNVMLVGCGQMGSALALGWDKQNLLNSLYIKDPSGVSTELSSIHNLFHVKQDMGKSLDETDIVILAVKPQIMDEVCQELRDLLPHGLPVLSIAAGKNTAYFQKHLSAHTPVIRAMPNTPSSIGAGITALYAAPELSNTHEEIATRLMEAVGQILWLEDEELMDTVTALSGSGPAYLFYLIEVMGKAGENLGLSTDQATQLARQTFIGAAKLAEAENNLSATALRENVTSPGGTTQAALDVLMDGRFQDIMNEAIKTAQKRSKELSD